MQQVLRRGTLEHGVQRVRVAVAAACPAVALVHVGHIRPDGSTGRHRGTPELHLGVLRRDGRRLEVEEGLEAVELRLDRAEEGHVAVAERESRSSSSTPR